MFCEKCGNKLPEIARFCPKCGTKINYSNFSINKIDANNDETILEVKPTRKFTYIALPKILENFIYIIILIFIFIIIMILLEARFTGEGARLTGQEKIYVRLIITALIAVFIAVPTVNIFFIICKFFIDKRKYESYVYTFYKDRVVFKDSFLAVSEKELKYKYIREIVKRQTFIEKKFGIGCITLYSNAESSLLNGISMINIENVDEIYEKVKDIINV